MIDIFYRLYRDIIDIVDIIHITDITDIVYSIAYISIWSVVSNIFYFPFHIWDVILPIDFHSIIFQDGF